MYKNLFIDLDNTLWAFLANAKEAFREVYDTLQFDRYFASYDAFYELYEPNNQRLWGLYGRGEITKDELNHERFLYPLRSVGVADEALARQMGEMALSIIPTKQELMPHARELLEYLYPKYNLYILSNGFQALQRKKMRSSHIEHYFDRVILSDDINITKPQPGIFLHALEVTNSRPEDSIMIGDNLEADIWGAANVGLNQIYYNVNGDAVPSLVNGQAFTPTHTVRSLHEILQIL